MDETTFYTLKESDLTSANLVIQVRFYPMTEDKFYRLINNSKKITGFSKDIFFIGLGILIKVACVWMQIVYTSYSNPKEIPSVTSKIDIWEYWAIVITFIIALGLYVTSKYVTNDRDRIIQEVKNFFKKNVKNE